MEHVDTLTVRQPKRRKSLEKSVLNQIVLNAVIIFLLVIMIYPLAMALWNVFKTDYTYAVSRWYPTLPLRFSNIGVAFKATYQYIINTVIVAVIGPLAMIFISSLAAFTFSQMKFPGKKLLFSMVIVLMMIPGVLTLVPTFIEYKMFGLSNNRLALILPIATGGCVFGVFLLTSFFDGLPKDLFEAAKIDGAEEFRCYALIGIPLCMPILGTLLIMQLVGVWNDYIWPMVIINDIKKITISGGLLLSFSSQYATNYPVTFAGYLLASTPLILVFIFANKFYIEGLISTSIKM